MRFKPLIRVRALCMFVAFIGGALPASAADVPKPLQALIHQYCTDCHDADVRKGGLDLTALQFDLTDRAHLDRWVSVFDKVSDGAMPPKNKPHPSPQQRQQFLAALQQPLIEADHARQVAHGRSVIRRLNRVEYENALSDLLHLPLRIVEQLPADARKEGFDTVGAALNVSSVQMEAYLSVLDRVLDQATALYEAPERRTWKLDYRDTHGIMQEYRRTGPFHILSDDVVFFAPEKHSHLNALLDHFTIPHSARYRVKVSAYAIRNPEPIILTIRTGGPGHSESDEVPKTLLGHVTVRSGEPQVFEFEAYLERGQFFRIYPASLPYMRFEPNVEVRQKDYQGPGVVVQWVEVDGPMLDAWPPASHQRLWGGVPTLPLPGARPNEDPNERLKHPPTDIAQPRMTRVTKVDKETGNQWRYDPAQGAGGEPIYKRARIPDPLHPTLRLAPSDPAAESGRLLRAFVPAAYRRDVADAEVQPFVTLARRLMEEGDDFEHAMRAAYKAVLTSPSFLYHRDTLPVPATASVGDNMLTDQALAERLAFFLWTSTPDKELLGVAAAGRLRDPAALRAQVERMLNDPKAERFLENFLVQWLDLRLLDFTSPDSDLYPEHDPVLQWSMQAETMAFFRELLRSDLSVRNIADSDFAVINSRLARHYGIAGVEDMTLRKVKLPPDSVRGGVLTQASVLKVTANGTTTSPVVRGAWVLGRIIGKPADPPPPNVPAIEPDIRGAVTVRQQLEKHRSAASCSACHAAIDPPGVALENFDVIGQWRDHYRALRPDAAELKVSYRPDRTVPIKYTRGLPVDAADHLADGRSFNDIRSFKQLLLADPDQIARNVAHKLLIYATGAPITFADRPRIEEILEQTRSRDHGFRSIIHAVVQSEPFRRK